MVHTYIYQIGKKLYWGVDDLSRTAIQRVLRPAMRLVIHEEATAWSSFQMPFRRRLWLWRHGFLSKADIIYDIDERTHYQYLSEYQRELTRSINGRWQEALRNKLLFHRLLRPFDAYRPTVYGYLKQGRFVPIDASNHSSDPENASTATTRPTANADDAVTQVSHQLKADGRLVLKPTYGAVGNRILVCSWFDDCYRVNGDERTDTEFDALITDLDEYLVCEFVEQAPYAAELYPGSTNTLRILTMWDPKLDEPFIPFAVQRIGTNSSAPVDNWSRGGLSAEVDRDTGELSQAVQYPYGDHLEKYTNHPETETQIAGTKVNGWRTVRDKILHIAANFPQLLYVGWDVLIGEDGEFTIIEANSCSDVDLLQVHRPLLNDPRARRFYEHHGVV